MVKGFEWRKKSMVDIGQKKKSLFKKPLLG
jgi:hypothetical protein